MKIVLYIAAVIFLFFYILLRKKGKNGNRESVGESIKLAAIATLVIIGCIMLFVLFIMSFADLGKPARPPWYE